jgi:predicted AAA+ superfamily ATPase
MTSEQTAEREFGALERIKDNYPKFVLTTDGFTQSRNGIQPLHVFRWLLAED